MPFRSKVIKCLNCGHELDAHQAVGGGEHTPQENDISICAYCGGIGQYDSEINLKPFTDKEWEELKAEDPDIYAMLQSLKK